MKTLTLALLMLQCFGLNTPLAQEKSKELYMSLEYQKAYESGTRMFDGSVSPTYWQNRSEYNIKVKVEPYDKILHGFAEITYFNNSPDSLKGIVFHSYPDYYKIESMHASQYIGHTFHEDLISGGMIIEDLIVEADTIDLEDTEKVSYRNSNYRVQLPIPLPPESNLNIQINWYYEIPGKGFRRSGAVDSTSMFIGYWYPEISVKDDIMGWDRIPYDGAIEFYHDHSDFTVEIEVPDDFIVWASAPPLNVEEVYPETILDRLEKVKNTYEEVTIVGKQDLSKGIKMKSNVWKYRMTNQPDFSFALSDHFVWKSCRYMDQKGEYILNTVYDSTNSIFNKALAMQKKSLNLFHNVFPVYPFPYDYFTVFNGMIGGGMEFPGMTNVGVFNAEYLINQGVENVTDYNVNLMTVFHEMFHMYFPFMMGINEKAHAWMDEGWAMYAEGFLPNRWNYPFSRPFLGYMISTPAMVPSFTQPYHWGLSGYNVSPISYYSLHHLLGDQLFKECLMTYMDRWKFKHPTPYDFMFTFNDASGMDLTWFWKRWYFDWGYPDVSIEKFADGELTILNKGGKPMAFTILYQYEDGSVFEEVVSPAIWKNTSTYKKKVSTEKKIKSIELKIPGGYDAVKENSIWTED